MNTKSILLKLSPELHAALKKKASKLGLTLTSYIRMILTQEVKRS
jgi:predicted DNA binding CopG/RHH family protein